MDELILNTSEGLYNASENMRDDSDHLGDLDLKHMSLMMEPDNAQGHINYGLSLLRMGFFDKGWPEIAWIHKTLVDDGNGGLIEMSLTHGLTGPEWDGKANLGGKTLIIVCEEGAGDFVQQMRLLIDLKLKVSGKVTFWVLPPAGLESMCKRHPFFDRIIKDKELIYARSYDYWVSTCQLYEFMNVGTPEPVGPYIKPCPKRKELWGEILDAKTTPGSFRVAFIWGGNPGHSNDANRSTSAESLSVLFDIPGVDFISLQRDARRSELRPYLGLRNVIDAGSFIDDFDDTAAIIANTDLLITIDSAPAHIGGAIGHPTWVLIPKVPDWRWLYDIEHSLWYKSVSVVRQLSDEQEGDWAPCISRLKTKLISHVEAHK